MDLSVDNFFPGFRFSIRAAVLEISAIPHTRCKKVIQRCGADAMKFAYSDQGKKLRLRGLNARVVQTGRIRTGDVARKES